MGGKLGRFKDAQQVQDIFKSPVLNLLKGFRSRHINRD